MKKTHLCVDFGWPESEPGLTKCGRIVERGPTLVFRMDDATCYGCKAKALKDVDRIEKRRNWRTYAKWQAGEYAHNTVKAGPPWKEYPRGEE